MPRLYPTGLAFIHDWPTAEIDVDDETAEKLLAYHPPVYTLQPPGQKAAAEPTEAPQDAGLLDSTPEE